MITHVQETIVKDVQDKLSALLQNNIPQHEIQEINELIEVTILNAFWKHGIAISTKVKSN